MIIILGTICSILLFAWIEATNKNYKQQYENEINKRALEISHGYRPPYYSPPPPSHEGLETKRKASSGSPFLLFVFMLLLLGFIYILSKDTKNDNFQAKRPNVEQVRQPVSPNEPRNELNAFD